MDSPKPTISLVSKASPQVIERGPVINPYEGIYAKRDSWFGHFEDQVRQAKTQAERSKERGDQEDFDRVESALAAFFASEDGARFIEKKKEIARAKLREDGKEAGIPERHADCDFDGYEARSADQTKAKTSVLAMVQNQESSAMVMLYGKPGTGKTHLGAAAVRERIKLRGKQMILKGAWCSKFALMATPVDISRRVRATYGDEAAETETKVIEDYSTCGLLVVDEIGAGSGSDHEKQMLCDVLCKRYENKLPTLMISNLGIEDIKKALGERVIDRMHEDVGSAFIPMVWGSYRPEQRKKS